MWAACSATRRMLSIRTGAGICHSVDRCCVLSRPSVISWVVGVGAAIWAQPATATHPRCSNVAAFGHCLYPARAKDRMLSVWQPLIAHLLMVLTAVCQFSLQQHGQDQS